MPERVRGRPRAAEAELRAYIRWINDRAYVELGAWAAWGGRRQEPLVQQGEKGATRDPAAAAVRFGQRLAQLRRRREMRPNGVPALARDVPTS